jgi:GntR family histidine utilization transcriptional repressor
MSDLSNGSNGLAVAEPSFARYEQVKAYIRQKLRSGEWKPGDRIPSENELVKVLGISRMTVNRAVRELSEQGALIRRGGVGTFVAESRPHSTLLMIARIGDEIRSRGHGYDWSIILKTEEAATEEVAAAFETPVGSRVFHLVCLHRENGTPVQLEDRYVNPSSAPKFLDQTFVSQPPSEYLLEVIPAHEIEHTVDAVLPGAEAALLDLAENEPCLLLTRRTWASNTPVTFAKLLYPASRYRLGCRFKPSTMGDRS